MKRLVATRLKSLFFIWFREIQEVDRKMDLRYPCFATNIYQSRRPAVSRRLNVASAYYVKLRGDFMICQWKFFFLNSFSCTFFSWQNICVRSDTDTELRRIFFIFFTNEKKKNLNNIFLFCREIMEEWVDCIRHKLSEMGILNPKGNLYTKMTPTKTRNPMSPLPQPPSEDNANMVAAENLTNVARSRTSIVDVSDQNNQSFTTSIYLNQEPAPHSEF